MIKVASGRERSVYAHLQNRPEVKDVYRLFGEYSFFVVMQAEERDDLSRILGEIEDEKFVVKAGPIILSRDHADWETCRAGQATA